MPDTATFTAATWGQLDLMVDTDPIALRDYAWAATREARRLQVLAEDQQRELGLARRHLDNCPTALAVADHDLDKARSNQ